MEDDVKETVNVEQHENNPNNNPKRKRTKDSYVSEAGLNLNNCNSLNICNSPSTIANSQAKLINTKRPTTVVNRRPENQDISERKKVVPGRQTYGELVRKRSNDIVILGDSIKNFSRHQKKKKISNQTMEDHTARLRYF